MKDIKIFEGNKVEIIEKDGVILFEIYSTGMALGYINYGKNKNNPLPHKIRINNVLQNAEIIGCVHGVNTYITEEQLYDFMLESKTEKVKPFRRWVTHVVLPSIRKNGAYIANQENLNEDELIAKALVAAQNIINRQKQKLIEQQPLVTFANQVANSSDTVDMGEMAKLIADKGVDIGRNRLIDYLKRRGVLMNSGIPYQKYITKGYFKVIEVVKHTAYGDKTYLKTLCTGLGQVRIVDFVLAEFQRSVQQNGNNTKTYN